MWTPMCVPIYGYASWKNKFWRIFTPTWHNWRERHTWGSKHTGHAQDTVLTIPHWRCHFPYCRFVHINTQRWHLCCPCSLRSRINWTGWQNRDTLPALQPTRVHSGGVVKTWTEDIFIHSQSQDSVVAFWSICYYKTSAHSDQTGS